MKKKIAAIVLSLLASSSPLAAAACDGSNKADAETVVASYVRIGESGAITLMVNDKPFLQTGIQIRTEALLNCGDIYEYDEYEKYFKTAAELGVNTVLCSIDWKDLEPLFGVYDMTAPRAFLGFAEQYGLKVEFLWFSTCMCALSHEYQLPDYILENTATYPRYKFNNGLDYITRQQALYGKQYLLDFANPDLMARETIVIGKLMDYVYEWEKARGFPKVLIGVQVYNETNILLDEPNLELDRQFSYAGAGTTAAAVWAKLLTAMENAAGCFKSAKYKVYTRTNLAGLWRGGYKAAEDLYALQNIDCVGFDPYIYAPEGLTYGIDFWRDRLPQNLMHIAENGGEYYNTDALTLLSISKNCGYYVYELTRSIGFPGENDQGITEKGTLKDKDYSRSGSNYPADGVVLPKDNYTDRARGMFRDLNKAWLPAADASPGNFAVFNVFEEYLPREVDVAYADTENYSVKFSTEDSALGFAIEYGGAVYALATRSASMEFSSGRAYAESGYFNKDGIWTAMGTSPMTEGRLNLTPHILYKVIK
jgi:hypothetical protein